MITTKTLFHPRFEPQESWLRSMLLFYDTVHSIVPANAGYEPSAGIAELREKLPEAFITLSPNKQDLEHGWDEYEALLTVIKELKKHDDDNVEQVLSKFDYVDNVPCLEVGTIARMHTGKMADFLRSDLIELDMAEQKDENWLTIDRRIGDLILSLLADRMVQNRPKELIFTSSDQETSFALAACGELYRDQANNRNLEAYLASTVLTLEIPQFLAELPLDTYIEIRKRYQEKKDVFRLAMQELQNLYLQGSFEEPKDFTRRIEKVVKEFSVEMQKLRESHSSIKLLKWAPIAIGGIVSIAAAAVSGPIVAIPAAFVGLGIQVLQSSNEKPVIGTYRAKAQSLLIQLENELSWNQNWLGRVFSRWR